ncbi:uncharacterized protein LOC143056563 [Mytilus galloprovincialis]|uniref:uncharacterized protein LOC143056563 n=1 Tax=Mytilus galloprovincialis TaxID=29158 RepID=UPI003F7B55AC
MAGRNRVIPVESIKNRKSPGTKLHRSNSLSSTLSLSPTELNEAIMGMLTVGKRLEPCKRVCIGNPITTAGQRKQLAKMLTVVLFPLAVLTAITAVDFSNSLSMYMNTAEVMMRIEFGVELGDFLMALQNERDMSSLYLSRIGSDTKSDLLQAYPQTDEALDKLSSWPVSSSNKLKEFQSREWYINFINRHRYELDSTNTSVTAEINFYSNHIDIFIRWMYEAVSELNTGLIWKTLVGYQELIISSEYIGRERGYGIYYYSVGSFRDRSHYILFIESQDTARAHFESARMYSETASDIYQKNLDTNNDTLQEINKLRNEIKINSSLVQEGSTSAAKWWFSNMSIYRDVMRNTQRLLTSKINRLLEQNAALDMTNMIIAAAIFLGIIMVSPTITFSVYKLTSNIQKYSLQIARKTKALNKEKKQSEEILFQMLPKSVAQHLKENHSVNAEQFQECTILQSDMVGFTKLSSNSSPLQVTEMLNILFSCFDNRINLYDVYKVETVGDGYLVVSGVPRRNRHRHASEIATLSLDLLHHVTRLELPQFPGEKFKIRVGCHSGPVVAGVVGNKNPRYCLFGSTVRVAAIMESSAEVNKIQISQSTFTLLHEMGGFEMRPRDVSKVTVGVELRKHGSSERTFWLLKKELIEWEEEFCSSPSDGASLGSSL